MSRGVMKVDMVPVSADDHSATFSRARSWAFTANETLAAVTLGEVEEVAREYVVVFSKESNAPSSIIVLLGVDGKNAFVDERGNWIAQSIPTAFKIYPFRLISGNKPDQFIVARDKNAPHFNSSDGQSLFGPDKKPTEFLDQITAELINMHRSFLEGQALVKQLEDAGLIEERRIDIQLIDGSYRSFAGFKAINEERLIGLDPEVQKRFVHPVQRSCSRSIERPSAILRD